MNGSSDGRILATLTSSSHNRRASTGRLRRGNVVALTALMMTVLAGILAFSIDVGYLCVVRTELQRTADCAALAAAGSLHEPIDSVKLFEYESPFQIDVARVNGQDYAARNGAGPYLEGRGNHRLHVDLNTANHPDGDIVLGRMMGPQWVVGEIHPNAIQVRVPLEEQHQNGSLRLLLGKMLGLQSTDLSATAMASVVNYPFMMPIVTAKSHFEATSGPDHFSFEDGRVVNQPDQIPEIVVYPGQWNGEGLPPGNFGAVEIGPSSGTTTLRRQIDGGPNADDFSYHGGSLHTGMELSGSTGISADIETAFVGGNADGTRYSGVIGQVRFMPLYTTVQGNGTNALFTIDQFVAVRIMEVSLKSGTKRIVVQPIELEDELLTQVRLIR